jgi:hypothetical protein
LGRTGAFGYLLYGWESTFKGGATTRDKVFGRGQRVTGVTTRNNLENIYEIGSRVVSKGIFKQLEGSLGLEWILANPWFFKAVMGKVTTTGSVAPYTHTFEKDKSFVSMDVELGFAGETANVLRRLKGAVFNSLTLTGTVGDAIKCRGDILYFDESVTAGTLGTASVDTFDPFIWSQATLKIPAGGNALAEVQSFEITIANNALPIFGLGDYKAGNVAPQALDITGRLSITMKDKTFLDYLRTEVADCEFKITNGLTGASERSITFNGTGVLFGESSSTMEPNALVLEDLPITIRDATIVAVNATSTVP